MWSISGSKSFRTCQRRWYFKNVVASAVANDPFRQRAYRLSKLDSISAWRGRIVDDTITNIVIPSVRDKNPVSFERAKRYALQLFDRRLAFARQHRVHDPSLSPSEAGLDFAAFHCMEYEGVVPEEEILKARDEVVLALSHFYLMDQVKKQIASAEYLITQRPLIFTHSDVTVRAVPDLIAFYHGAPPLIIDWKVHVFGLQEAWLQLAVYGLALRRCKPHKDFPAELSRWRETDVHLLEVQLLTNTAREYTLEADDVEQAEGYIADSAMEMSLVIDGRSYKQMSPSDFLVTQFPNACERCPFRAICWEDLQ